MGTEPTNKPEMARQFSKALSWNYLGVVIKSVSSLVLSIPLARMLGPGPFGQVAMAWLIIGFGTLIANAGFGSALVQAPEVDEHQIRQVFTIQMGLGLFWLGVVYAGSPLIANYFHDPHAVSVLRGLSWMFPFQALGAVATSLLQRKLEFKTIQIAQAVAYLFGYLVLGLPMAWLGLGVWCLVVAQLAQSLCYSLIVFAMASHSLRPLLPSPNNRSMGVFGIKVLATNICNYTIGNIDNVIVGRVMGVLPLGLYSRVFNLITFPLMSLISTLQGVLFPAYARIQDQRDLVEKVYMASFEAIALITLPAFLFVSVCAHTLMAGLFGQKWMLGVPVLRALAAGMPFIALLGLAGPLLWGVGKVERELRSQFVVTLLTLPTLLWSATRNLELFSWTVVVIYAVRFVFMTGEIRLLLGLPLAAIGRALAAGLGLTLVTVGPVALLERAALTLAWPPMAAFALESAVFCALFLVAVKLTRGLLLGTGLRWMIPAWAKTTTPGRRALVDRWLGFAPGEGLENLP